MKEQKIEFRKLMDMLKQIDGYYQIGLTNDQIIKLTQGLRETGFQEPERSEEEQEPETILIASTLLVKVLDDARILCQRYGVDTGTNLLEMSRQLICIAENNSPTCADYKR